MDLDAIRAAAQAQGMRVTEGIEDMAGYLSHQVADSAGVAGPLRDGDGASGVIRVGGSVVATWGDYHRSEMLFSATKTFVSIVAGLAHDQGLLPDVDEPVVWRVDLPELGTPDGRTITWRHLLQQTSQWQGELWGIPTGADAQSIWADGAPGSVWAYNDVRVNLLCLALTVLWGRSLPDVLGEYLLDAVDASSSWSWHGYRDSFVGVNGQAVPVVSGGAHWGGGLWMSAADLALAGEVFLRPGPVSAEWIGWSWQPCEIRPQYGFLWWRNDTGAVFAEAPTTGRCARGNGGRHLLWVDPARDLVIASHWGDEVGTLLRDVSAAV
jgi:CubicO group peptidase (beta-lactamase class C family)